MRLFELPATGPRERGRAHGEAFRGEIASLAEIRLYLCGQMSGGTREQILEMARRHWPVLQGFDGPLHDELAGIAEGAAIDPALVVVLNHYTDLRDLKYGASAADVATDGCSVIYGRTPEGAVAAQTWDMHATSLPYVLMMKVPALDDRPAAWVLTLTGCLGMAGLNARGVALCINNLPATDAAIGPVWSAVVRRGLACATAGDACELLMASRHASGRHFLVADEKAAFGIETTGARRKLIFRGDQKDYVHTNHCVDPDLAACTSIAAGATTFDRYGFLRGRLDRQPLAGAADAWELLGSVEGYPRSVCSNMTTPEAPHGAATCAGLVMTPARREALACSGLTHRATPQRFTFEGA